MKSPEFTRYVNQEESMHGFNFAEIFTWACTHADIFKRASQEARAFGIGAKDSHDQKLAFLLCAYIKAEEAATDIEAANKIRGAIERREYIRKWERDSRLHGQVCLDGNFTPKQLRAIALLLEKGKL